MFADPKALPWHEDAPDGLCWECPDCPSWATLGGNAAFHALKTEHGRPSLVPISRAASAPPPDPEPRPKGCARCGHYRIEHAIACHRTSCSCPSWVEPVESPDPEPRAQHTPGPWVASDRDDGDHLHPVRFVSKPIDERSRYLIAEVVYPPSSRGTVGAEEREANARLIASAPDLLKDNERLKVDVCVEIGLRETAERQRDELAAALTGPDPDPEVMRITWLGDLLKCYEAEHDWTTDEDPDATGEMLTQVRLLLEDGRAALRKAGRLPS